MPYASTYNRKFGALRDRRESDLLLSGMGAANVRHDWLERADFATGALTYRIDHTTFLKTQTTSSIVRKAGIAGDVIGIARVNEGKARMTYGDNILEITDGDCFVFGAEQGFVCEISDYQDKSLVLIPRSHLRHLGLGGTLLRTEGEFIARDGVADILFNHLDAVAQRLERGPSLSGRALAGVNSATAQMAAALLVENGPTKEADLVSAAKALIDDHLLDPNLTPSAVAAALHVSVRTLYRSFQGFDHSIADYIRSARLFHAKREFDLKGRSVNISVVAERWGFTDTSYFAKLFRQQFGCLPSDYVRGL